MRLVSKSPQARIPHFWVEDYNEDDKKFFEGLGFVETPVTEIMKQFRIKPTLNFKGSGDWGGMSQEEFDTIVDAMCEKYNQEEFDIYKMNPYD